MLLVFAQAAFNLNPLFSPTRPNQIVLLYTLSTFIFLVLLVFRLRPAAHSGESVGRTKTAEAGFQVQDQPSRIVDIVDADPAVCLFLFAFGLVNRSIDKWFSVPVDEIFSATTDMTIEWQHEHESLARSILTQLGQEPQQDLEQLRQNFHAEGVHRPGREWADRALCSRRGIKPKPTLQNRFRLRFETATKRFRMPLPIGSASERGTEAQKNLRFSQRFFQLRHESRN